MKKLFLKTILSIALSIGFVATSSANVEENNDWDCQEAETCGLGHWLCGDSDEDKDIQQEVWIQILCEE